MGVKNYKGYADPSHVVPVEEASKLLGKKGTVFVDTRNYWKFVKGHIPGAVNLELYGFHWVDTSPEGVGAFTKEMAMLLGAAGITRDTPVVFYQNNSGYDAARGVWLLEFLGNRRGMLLDGGLNLWKRKGLPVSAKDSEFERARFVPKVDESVVCDLAQMRERVKRRDSTILDTRSPGEFTGEFRRALKLGHVAGSTNIEWKNALRRDGTLKDARQLAKLYGHLEPETGVVTYCQSGYRAAHSWLVLKLLGFGDVRNYLGSWYEWGNGEATPVER